MKKTYNIMNVESLESFTNISSDDAIKKIGCARSYFYEVSSGKKRRALGWRVEVYNRDKTPFSEKEKPIKDMSGSNNPMYGKPGTFKGKHHSEDSRKKLSESRVGRYKGLENPKSKLMTVDNDLLNIHESGITSERAIQITNIKKSTLYEAARDRVPFNGWRIGYVEDVGKPFNQRERQPSWREKLKLGLAFEDSTEIKGRVYLHRNKINGKCYVGQTTQENIEQRWKDGKGYKTSQIFLRAVKKYGWDSFEHIVLPEIYRTQKELNEAETRTIEKYDSIKNGYNILPGGFINPMSNPESREKARKAITGRKRTPEQIERWKKSYFSRSDEKKAITSEKISKAKKGRRTT